MSAKILKGAEVIEAMDSQTSRDIEKLKAKGVRPTLAILRVGERQDDVAYERSAIKRAEKVGVTTRTIIFSEDVTQGELMATVEGLNEDDEVHGVLMFRPLPDHIDEDAVCNALDPAKDVDGTTDLSLGGVFADNGMGFAPCTAQSCIEVLEHYGCELKGKRAVVVGRSLVVGKPVALMLLDRDATVTIAHSRTKDLADITRRADIIVSCVGRAGMIDAEYLSPGQVIIDVGINFDDEGKMTGDVAFDQAVEIVDAITPVPGGVGGVTTSVLCKHVVEVAKGQLI